VSLGRTRSVALHGVDGAVVDVEADVAQGLPWFTITGMPDPACAQSRDRVKAAAANSGVPIPNRRLTINLSPASLPKSGAGFDLPIAVAVLAAAGVIPMPAIDRVVHLGELSLDGSIRAVRGVLPAVLAAVRDGFTDVVVPVPNAAEARLVPGAQVHAASTLGDLVAHYCGHPPRGSDAAGSAPFDNSSGFGDGSGQSDGSGQAVPEPRLDGAASDVPDLVDVVGQDEARLALEVAAAGRHHLLMVGPPGAGKTMLAERLPGLLPALSRDQAIEVTAIHSVLGLLPAADALIRLAPFVAPHHGASMPAIIGGGSGVARPGAISRAHHGVLFLDESPEFKRTVLDALRQPIETGEVVVARAAGVVRYPSRFQLVLAANPCPCGRGFGKGADCSCSPKARRDYLGRLSDPLRDRVDLQLAVHAVSRVALAGPRGETSAVVAARVAEARQVQRQRLTGTSWRVNGDVPGAALRNGPLRLPAQVTTDLDRAMDRGMLTLRAYDRVLRLAWTVSDLRTAAAPTRADVGIALSLRVQSAVAA